MINIFEQPLLMQLLGFIIFAAFIILIKRWFAPKDKMSGFLVSDTGRYCLARLQAVMWAVVIMS